MTARNSQSRGASTRSAAQNQTRDRRRRAEDRLREARQQRRSERRIRIRQFFITLGLILADCFFGWFAMISAVRVRYDSLQETIRADIDHKAALLTAVCTLFVWVAMRQDRAIWRYTSMTDFRRLFIGVLVVMMAVPLLLFFFVDRGNNFPRSAPIIAGIIFALAIMLSRLITMAVRSGDIGALFRMPKKDAHDAILIGTASEIYTYLRDKARQAEVSYNAVGLIETSGQYGGREIQSIPVLGSLNALEAAYPALAARRDRPVHLISLDPNPDRREAAQLIKLAANLGAPLARTTVNKGEGLTPFEAADLIGREPRVLDMAPVSDLISGRRVLVTGAGGSIGSELSAQIARLAPSHLALVDASEFNLYELERRLTPFTSGSGAGSWRSYLADVCNSGRMAEIFEAERPEIVLHAAALKHVPLGERNPVETLRTNVLGTQVTLDMCEIYGVEHFVLISTDKAVEPANVMGASKRVVELLTLARQNQMPGLHACAVRFGNVLGSTGSVITLFEEQIAMGGPVTVTHKDMTRYFMTVQEASELVLQAAALNAGQASDAAHIYVLEMGEPVNIRQLAKNLIRLRGKVPDQDIEIRHVGLRPGEKLAERLTRSEEMLSRTTVPGVDRFDACVVDPEDILAKVERLLEAIKQRDRRAIKDALSALLEGYAPRDTLDGLPVMHDLPRLTDVASINRK